MNTFLNQHNNLNLTGIVSLTANDISLFQLTDEGLEEVKNIENIFLKYNNISTVQDREIPIGGGLSYSIKEWSNPISNNQVPGLQALIEYLESNFRKNTDDSIITNNYYITKKYNNNINRYETSNFYKHNYITQYNKYNQIYKDDTFNYNTKKYITNKHFHETYFKEDIFNYNKITNINNTMKKIPTYINIENNYTFVKHNNQQLLNMILDLQNQINDLQNQINNLQ